MRERAAANLLSMPGLTVLAVEGDVVSVGVPRRDLRAALAHMPRLHSLHLSMNGLQPTATESVGRIGADMGERHLHVACNALCGPGLAAIGAWAAACSGLEMLNVSDQRAARRRRGGTRARVMTAAEMEVLARAFAVHTAAAKLMVIAHGCRSVCAAEKAAVKAALGAAVLVRGEIRSDED